MSSSKLFHQSSTCLFVLHGWFKTYKVSSFRVAVLWEADSWILSQRKVASKLFTIELFLHIFLKVQVLQTYDCALLHTKQTVIKLYSKNRSLQHNGVQKEVYANSVSIHVCIIIFTQRHLQHHLSHGFMCVVHCFWYQIGPHNNLNCEEKKWRKQKKTLCVILAKFVNY